MCRPERRCRFTLKWQLLGGAARQLGDSSRRSRSARTDRRDPTTPAWGFTQPTEGGPIAE